MAQRILGEGTNFGAAFGVVVVEDGIRTVRQDEGEVFRACGGDDCKTGPKLSI